MKILRIGALRQLLSKTVVNGYSAVFGISCNLNDNIVQLSSSLDFGDVQSTVALSKAKILGKPPKEIAMKIVSHIKSSNELNGICNDITVGGNGYINFKFSDDQIASFANAALNNNNIGPSDDTAANSTGEVIAIDYSSPNIAKEMHVVMSYC